MTIAAMIRSMLENNRQMTLALLAELDGKALAYQGPGGLNNHALWIMAHIAHSEANLARWGGAKVAVEPLAPVDLIGRGSTPQPDAANYPAKPQVLAYAAAVREQVLAALAAMDPADMDQPAVGENLPPVFKTRGDCWRILVTHEAMHAGQLTVIRRELGLPPVRA